MRFAFTVVFVALAACGIFLPTVWRARAKSLCFFLFFDLGMASTQRRQDRRGG